MDANANGFEGRDTEEETTVGEECRRAGSTRLVTNDPAPGIYLSDGASGV